MLWKLVVFFLKKGIIEIYRFGHGKWHLWWSDLKQNKIYNLLCFAFMTNRHWQIHPTLPSLIALMELIFICVPLITWKLHTFYAWHILHSFSKRLWREQEKKKHLSVFSSFTAAIDHLPSNQSCFMGPLFSTIVVTKWQQKGTVHKKIWWRFLGGFFFPLCF